MMTDCSLTSHLAEIQEKAVTMEQNLLQTMAKQEGLTESFKAQHMMEWVQRMNNLRHSAQEIVQAELIFS